MQRERSESVPKNVRGLAAVEIEAETDRDARPAHETVRPNVVEEYI